MLIIVHIFAYCKFSVVLNCSLKQLLKKNVHSHISHVVIIFCPDILFIVEYKYNQSKYDYE